VPRQAHGSGQSQATKARSVVADARDILGGDGILSENHAAGQHADVQALIVGREITGLSAISGRKPERR
jgi:glutaryl-CoA dehydrogenase